MLQAANTDLFNPIVPKLTIVSAKSIWQNPLQIMPVKSVKANWRIFILCNLGTNRLIQEIKTVRICDEFLPYSVPLYSNRKGLNTQWWPNDSRS